MIIDLKDRISMASFAVFCRSVAMDTKCGIIGLTSGVFDLFHTQHLHVLERARRLCHVLIVGVGTDRLVKEDKGNDRPIFPERDRLAIINGLRCVDACFLMDSEEDYGDIAARFVTPDHRGVHFKNETWANRVTDIPGYKSEANYLSMCYSTAVNNNRIGNVIIIPRGNTIDSTSDVIKKIKG